MLEINTFGRKLLEKASSYLPRAATTWSANRATYCLNSSLSVPAPHSISRLADGLGRQVLEETAQTARKNRTHRSTHESQRTGHRRLSLSPSSKYATRSAFVRSLRSEALVPPYLRSLLMMSAQPCITSTALRAIWSSPSLRSTHPVSLKGVEESTESTPSTGQSGAERSSADQAKMGTLSMAFLSGATFACCESRIPHLL